MCSWHEGATSARWRAPNATPAPRQDRDLPDGLRGVREGTQLGGGCGFYFIAPRGGKKETRQQDDAALDEAKQEAIDGTDLFEY